MQADVSAPVKAYSFRITFREAVDESWRVLRGTTVYDIKAVRQDLTNREWTDLVCEVGGSNG
jgi:SPP1 family predicted phage head-tail adaptor